MHIIIRYHMEPQDDASLDTRKNCPRYDEYI